MSIATGQRIYYARVGSEARRNKFAFQLSRLIAGQPAAYALLKLAFRERLTPLTAAAWASSASLTTLDISRELLRHYVFANSGDTFSLSLFQSAPRTRTVSVAHADARRLSPSKDYALLIENFRFIFRYRHFNESREAITPTRRR